MEIKITASINKLGATSARIIKEVAEQLGIESITITSTQRPPRVQAEAMLSNIEDNILIGYRAPGRAVNDLARKLRGQNIPREQILDAMVAKIKEFNAMRPAKRVSSHCVDDEEYERLNVIDISFWKIPEDKRIPFLAAMNARDEVVKVLQPLSKTIRGYDAGEPALHFEIRQ
jgi:hypothetical protein